MHRIVGPVRAVEFARSWQVVGSERESEVAVPGIEVVDVCVVVPVEVAGTQVAVVAAAVAAAPM